MAVVVVMVMVVHVMSLACPSQHCHMGEAALAVLQPVKQPVSDSLQQRVVRGGEERGAIPVPRLQCTARCISCRGGQAGGGGGAEERGAPCRPCMAYRRKGEADGVMRAAFQ